MNRVVIIGNLTKDPVTNTTPAGQTVCNFTVAVNRKRTKQNDHPEADFFRVAAWGATGENCQKYLGKGKKVAVVGSVQVSTYTDNNGTVKAQIEIPFAQEVEFLSPKDGEQADGAHPAQASAPGEFVKVETDELPFDRGLAYPQQKGI